jgi:hypothetical protein
MVGGSNMPKKKHPKGWKEDYYTRHNGVAAGLEAIRGIRERTEAAGQKGYHPESIPETPSPTQQRRFPQAREVVQTDIEKLLKD